MQLKDALIEAAFKAGMFSNLRDKRRHATDRVELTFNEYPELRNLTLQEFRHGDGDLYLDALEMFTKREVESDTFRKFELALDRLSLDHGGRQEVPTKSNGGRANSTGDKWVSPGRLVLTWPNLDPTARLVLFTMAAHGDNKGQGIWCSQETIAELLGNKSTEPVRRAWRRLEKLGAITKTELERPHRSARWRINKGPRVI